MDFNTLAQQLGLESDEFYMLVELFVEVSNADLDNLESGIKKEDTKQIVEAAHSIKGAAINLGIEEITDIAKDVEEKAREKNLDGADEAVQIIRKELDRINASLKEQE